MRKPINKKALWLTLLAPDILILTIIVVTSVIYLFIN